MNPEFSTWYAAQGLKSGDRVSIIPREHPYYGYCCLFDRISDDRISLRVPFGSYDEYCTALISEVLIPNATQF